jgi:hypothetical protein
MPKDLFFSELEKLRSERTAAAMDALRKFSEKTSDSIIPPVTDFETENN